MGAYLELVVPFYEAADPAKDIALAVKRIRQFGAEAFIISSDCGGVNDPNPPDCLALGVRALRANGITDREIDIMLTENPARYLGLPVVAIR